MEVQIFLFPDFETLDACGPVEILGRQEGYILRYVSNAGGIIKSSQGLPVMTERADRVGEADILLIPGGQGTRTLVDDAAFIAQLRAHAERAACCLTVCTGSVLLAKTGLLDGRKATSNKCAFSWACTQRPEVIWIGHARWVTDGKYYTSSGVSAGIDMALGFIADRYGTEQAQVMAKSIEYVWNGDKEKDDFAAEGQNGETASE